MKKNIISMICASMFVALVAISCTEEKTFVFDAYETGTVNFKVFNYCVEGNDSAYSSPHPYGDYSNYNSFWFDYYDTATGEFLSTFKQYNEHSNEVWVGGFNTLEVTFLPSNPAEKSCVFTFPDGTTKTAEAYQTVTWMLDRDSYRKAIGVNNDYNNWLIKAESEYNVNTTTVRNVGYVRVRANEANVFFYDTVAKKWYYGNWVELPNLEVYGREVEFSAFNATVQNTIAGSDDSAVGVKYDINDGYQLWGSRDSSFPLKAFYYDYEDPNTGALTPVYNDYNIRLDYRNQMWVGGNNVIVFNVKLDDAEDKVELVFPDGTSHVCENLSGTWEWVIDSSVIQRGVEWYGYNKDMLVVKAIRRVEAFGLTYYNQSYIMLTVTGGEEKAGMVVFDAGRGWKVEDWTGNRSR